QPGNPVSQFPGDSRHARLPIGIAMTVACDISVQEGPDHRPVTDEEDPRNTLLRRPSPRQRLEQERSRRLARGDRTGGRAPNTMSIESKTVMHQPPDLLVVLPFRMCGAEVNYATVGTPDARHHRTLGIVETKQSPHVSVVPD